jgi:hypothetical protein
MSWFWIWVGGAIVVILVIAVVMDRRRRGGWFMGYSQSSREDRISGDEEWGGKDKGSPQGWG